MPLAFLKKIFGSANDRFLKSLRKIIQQINQLEPSLQKLSDQELVGRTQWLKDRLSQGETLEQILPDAFATVREAAVRVLGQRHYDVQLIGGMVLHRGMIAEMKTGEGKTLVSTLAAYLNALSGKGVHIVTVNDYLAKRDAEWMGQIYRFLGLSVGVIVHGLNDDQRRAAYQCDITYGTNNELGFDYLRDNMKYRLEDMVQRNFNYAIIDEVDSILIDEARTPLIISGPTEDNSDLYKKINELIPALGESDYEKDEKSRQVTLTDPGIEKIEGLLREKGLMSEGSLYDLNNISFLHHIQAALRAHKLFERDVAYIVKDNKVVIIDEFTGRMMEGRRYSEGLHQALEAKENVAIQNENQTLASITFQNYFRLYPKLAGMTGTAMTEAPEFSEIYNLEVIAIPTNRPMQRKDEQDEVYRTAQEKYQSIINLILECRKKQQPVLVGTVSIEKSEIISNLLKQRHIDHQVLNARYHEKEAAIIAQAGIPGAVTIATNMAGRGTDIQLGGNVDMRIKQEVLPTDSDDIKKRKIDKIKAEVEVAKQKVLAVGGLFIIGTERHESRRIDNQLRGRAGRQGDPGISRFFLSLEDDLMRIFGSERLDALLVRFGLKEGEAITHPWVTKALEKAQQKVEARNFEIRKNLLRYDNVMNDQRRVIYEQRRDLMKNDSVREMVYDMRHQVINDIVSTHLPAKAYAEEWNIKGLHEECLRLLALDLPLQQWAKEDVTAEEIGERILAASNEKMDGKIAKHGTEMMQFAEKSILLQLLDQSWKEHLLTLDHLRQGIGLRAYGQRDPLNEYKREAFDMFSSFLARLREQTTAVLSHLEIRSEQPADSQAKTRGNQGQQSIGPSAQKPTTTNTKPNTTSAPDLPPGWQSTPRNAPCPCGSGKKFKQCHGKI
ncbi:MAG: preprotein translocase subunit SecA [Alphaproteobacteria bacterium]|nr:preprotein translocase subunit SecA [Alphaproteobacteria bacterium]